MQVAINCAGLSKGIASVSSQILHNVFGLEQFLQVCEGMENLKAVLTLSSCFTHVDRECLEEKLYPVQQSLLVFLQPTGNSSPKNHPGMTLNILGFESFIFPSSRLSFAGSRFSTICS